ncbi:MULTISPECIES: hypothetical protein [Saccharothrix]|uniref:hypothetical protein n=1 Tax=Saccharothrix TaxID=2071 RepID=UPI00093E2C94|nr:hypothetical protein [Saccharothrix sp. CB00851]OKI18690.1 hypothetical protein A6A25_39320 [Saccharothrix sp. CB00851]
MTVFDNETAIVNRDGEGAGPEVRTSSAEDVRDDLKALNRNLVENAWFVPFYRMTYALVTDGGVKATPQSGMAVPSLYNYQPAG